MSEQRYTKQRAGRGKSRWVLVDMERLPVFPEVQQARDAWEGREVWFQMPDEQSWRRGRVKHIYNTGAVRVMVYQQGVPGGLLFAFHLKHIPLFLRYA